MEAYDIILKKRNGAVLNPDEIKYMVRGYTEGIIPDYQMAALLMAVYYQGLDMEETAHLTTAMVSSGEVMDLSSIAGKKVDKHSTGGVGDKTTLVLIPLAACQGLKLAKLSGRGLGHTGGTADKLRSIPGFKMDLSRGKFLRIVDSVGAAILTQSEEMVPADKKIYELRDVTAVVDSIPLIASSIMSKKIASGSDGVVLDVKVGSGAFTKDREGALALAESMVDIGARVGMPCRAVLSNMDQPLGYAVGNSLEVEEAISTLRGGGPADLRELCVELGLQMMLLHDPDLDRDRAKRGLEDTLDSGKALEKFREIISAQGGDPKILDDPLGLPKSKYCMEIHSSQRGYVQEMDALKIGQGAMALGAGRKTKDQDIDLTAGIMLKKKVGDSVEIGEPLAVLHSNNPEALEMAGRLLLQAVTISTELRKMPRLVLDTIQ
ncbi:MAG: thymidine phosphorylase [Clostridia bacterium]|nr:thymidine phosphorylase [Clostridia bacterium]